MFGRTGPLVIAGREFRSRLILGTGKFSSPEAMRAALEASGAEMVTVALRRADLSGKKDPFANILEFIDPKRFLLLPNTSGAMNAEEAVRLARLAAAAGLPKWVKLEIHPDPRYLLPDPIETLKATEILVKEGFTVLPYIMPIRSWPSDCRKRGAPRSCRWGRPSVRIAGSSRAGRFASSSNKPRCRWWWMRAGRAEPRGRGDGTGGRCSAGEHRNCRAGDPNRMAVAFAQAVEAGRTAFEIGMGAQQWTASATSPLSGFLEEVS